MNAGVLAWVGVAVWIALSILALAGVVFIVADTLAKLRSVRRAFGWHRPSC